MWADDRARLATLLVGRVWAHTPEAGEDGSTRYARGAVRLDVAFLARDPAGRVYTPLRDGRGEWPEESFGDDVLALGGVRVHVVGRRALLADKSVRHADPATAAKDRADVRNLTHGP